MEMRINSISIFLTTVNICDFYWLITLNVDKTSLTLKTKTFFYNPNSEFDVCV